MAPITELKGPRVFILCFFGELLCWARGQDESSPSLPGRLARLPVSRWVCRPGSYMLRGPSGPSTMSPAPGTLQFLTCGFSFPGGSDGKASACNVGWPRFDHWVGKIPWRRKWQPTPVVVPGKFHGWSSVVGYSPWGCKELDMTEPLPSLFLYTICCVVLFYILFFLCLPHHVTFPKVISLLAIFTPYCQFCYLIIFLLWSNLYLEIQAIIVKVFLTYLFVYSTYRASNFC